MNGFYAECGLLLLWGILQASEGDGKGECPAPPAIDSAEYFAEWYALGTRVLYKCEKGYKRDIGITMRLTCKNTSGHAKWITYLNRPPACIAEADLIHLTSEEPLTEKWGDYSDSLQPVKKDVCGVPGTLKHATMVVTNYYVGQELNYTCLDDNGKWSALYGVSTCENDDGKGVWSALTLRCTNNKGTTKQLLTAGTNVQPLNAGTTKQHLSAAAAFSIAVTATIVIF